MAFSLTAEPANAGSVYAPATKIGKAQAQSCGTRGFSDIKGRCWQCPAGYSHKNILLPPSSGKACKKSGTTIKRKGIYKGKSIVGVCKKGSWLSLNNAKCYTCPAGYKHNVALYGTAKGVCYKKTKARYTKAKKTGGSLLCKKGFFSPNGGGTCWQCPAKAPLRTPLTLVTADKACRNSACGSSGERLCGIAEHILPCDKGLVPNYVRNQCVSVDLGVAACKATVGAIKAGKTVAGFAKMIGSSKLRTQKARDQLKNGVNRDALMSSITANIERYQNKVPELKRVMGLMKSKKGQLEALFSTDNFCSLSIAEQSKRLSALGLKPNFMQSSASLDSGGFFIRNAQAGSDDHFYIGYQVGVSGGVGIGVDATMLFVTDFRGNGGKYISVGPQIVTNAAIDVSPIGLQFFPKVNVDDFKGWGFGVGVSGGPPSKIVSAGVDVSFSEWYKEFQGFGLSGAIGLGYIPGDLSVSATHAWKMK